MTLCAIAASATVTLADDAGLPGDQAREFLQRRLDRSALPGDSRLDRRLSGGAVDGTVPVVVTPDGEQKADFETSIGQWSTWLAARDQKLIDEARALAPEGLELKAPKAAKANRDVDVWTRGSLAPSTDLGEFYTSSVGADVKVDSRLVIGGMVQMDRAKELAAGTNALADGEAYLAGPYMGLRVTDHITAGLTTAWGQGFDTIASGSNAYALDTSRRITEAKVKGDWAVNEWRIAPVATFNLREETAGGSDTAASVSNRTVSVGPEVSRPYSLEDGTRIEPFARINGNLDLNALPETGSTALTGATSTGVGAGFTLSKPDEYTLRATTDLDGLGTDTDEVRAKLQLSVPLK
ncbi:MAG: hypothetical protein AB7U38_05490 [Hyphomicrobiales bacterium]